MARQNREPSWNAPKVCARHRRQLAAGLAMLTISAGLFASSSFAAAPGESTSCTATAPTPTNERDGVKSTVVPGKPGVLLGCRYAVEPTSTSADGSALTSADLLSPSLYARALNGAKPAEDVQSCAASGGLIALIFRYPDRSRVLVTVQPDGCRLATNGTRTVVLPQKVITQLTTSLGAG